MKCRIIGNSFFCCDETAEMQEKIQEALSELDRQTKGYSMCDLFGLISGDVDERFVLELIKVRGERLETDLAEARAEIEGLKNEADKWRTESRSKDDARLNLSSAADGIKYLARQAFNKDKIIERMLELLKMCDTTHLVSPAIAHEIKRLCEIHGYGAVLATAQRQWEEKDPRGCFTLGPCKATVKAALEAAERGEK